MHETDDCLCAHARFHDMKFVFFKWRNYKYFLVYIHTEFIEISTSYLGEHLQILAEPLTTLR